MVYRLSFPIIKKPRSAELLKTYFGIENSHLYVESESCTSLRIVNHVTNSNGDDNCSKFVFVFFANLEANYTPLDKFKIAKENVHSLQKIMHLNMEQKHLTSFPHDNQHTFVC